MADLLTNISIKKTPCNSCRQRKRKCSYGNPCERCIKLGTQCVYTILPSPKDLEYLQEIEYIEQIELLENQMVTIESEMNTLKLAQNKNFSHHSAETTVETDYPSPVSLYSQDYRIPKDEETNKQNDKNTDQKSQYQKASQSFMIAKYNQMEASITKQEETKPWQLTLKNGHLIIDTYVNSYSELMSSLRNMLATQKQAEYPLLSPHISLHTKTAITDTLSIVMWRKYGKSRLKAMIKNKTFLLLNETSEEVKVVPVDTLNTLTLQLIHAYIQCIHTVRFSIHVRSFIKLFMSDQQSILNSPAVMALCSDICQRPCKHISKILPANTASDYALYYFEQSRNLISDRFDEMDIEVLTTYVFMASYKVKAKKYDESLKYLSMAETIYNALLPSYESAMKKKDGPPEAKLLNRLYRNICHTRHILELNDILNQKSDKQKMIRKLLSFPNNPDHSFVQPTDDDSELELKHIHLKNLIYKLHDHIKHAAKMAIGPDLPAFVGAFTHHIEMAMHHWYKHELSTEFKLSLPLFEDISDLEFFTILELECGHSSPFGFLTTLTVYNEYIIASKSFFPKSPKEMLIDADKLLEHFYKIENELPDICDAKHENGLFWTKLLTKMKHIKSYHIKDFMETYEGTEDEYFRELIIAMNPSAIRISMPYIQKAIIASLNTVRLIQFLHTHDYSCLIDMRWVMNAWHTLLRTIRFEHELYDCSTITLNRIKANMLLCIGFMNDLANLSQNHSAHDVVTSMKEQLQSLL
ncbi:hypothetical protein G6F55_011871 [Rhizopus delemar]|uniref:Zn(2)-C6 fungal-type domain-containing protein n=2 Tax=Rhizopus TaxID=4842 RepID=A0A9P6Z4I4_9FUNG|nr:hypothetical protein G6F55_011871 [Rhizopus delemar]KAG1536403.1 hypothetical protein G6F51_010992 [Rhizopus arrhizus]KAG1497489.1 hypothetical protein G6F53_011960 [Rhizopus delemar]KAG1501987.1 hypothetical protein G6F54_002670 [Rhizopus delemar]KAG1519880.1 hypothetical protein G6F52_008192 [Rhizopus delemar]